MTFSNSFSFGKIFMSTISMVAFWLVSFSMLAQSPFNGVSVQEVPIPPAVAATIDAALIGPGSPRCWRVYVCMDDADWELQAMYGDNVDNWMTGTTTTFFQAALNSGEIATNVNPAFFPLEPSSEFDSWFTIGSGFGGASVYTSTTAIVPGTPSPFPTFESGSGFVVNDIIGTTVYGGWLPPNSEGQPDADNKLLIAQLTTDGIFSMTLNFQFRQLNTDGTVFIPVTTLQVTGVSVDGTPGAEPDICPIVFLSTELLSFEAKAADEQVNLTWATASETDNALFTIERSLDQVNYEEVSSMPGAGTTQSTSYYSSVDPNPYEGISYYRLKQTDTDGHSDYSNPKAVEFRSNANLSIYPNPAHDLVSINGKEGYVQSMRITNASGKVVSTVYPGTVRQIDLKELDLSPGVYFVEFTLLGGAVEHERLVIR